jgi:hypothetical protein
MPKNKSELQYLAMKIGSAYMTIDDMGTHASEGVNLCLNLIKSQRHENRMSDQEAEEHTVKVQAIGLDLQRESAEKSKSVAQLLDVVEKLKDDHSNDTELHQELLSIERACSGTHFFVAQQLLTIGDMSFAVAKLGGHDIDPDLERAWKQLSAQGTPTAH